MNETKSIIVSQRVPVCVILVLFLSLPFWPKAWCDVGWYVVPIQITKTDSTIELGFLPLFVTKIVGVEVGTNMKTEVNIQGEGVDSGFTFIRPITEGRIHPETLRIDTVKMVGIGYEFGEIEIKEVTNKGLRIRINADDFSLELKEVDTFFSHGFQTFHFATRVWTSHTDFFYRDERKHLSIAAVKKIGTIGEVLSIPYNPGD